MEKPFKEPMTLEAANFLIKRDGRYKENKSIIEAGTHGFAQGAKGFLHSLGAQFTDPINLAIGFASAGIGQSLLAGRTLGLAGKAAFVASSAMAETTISESIVYSQSDKLLRNYTADNLITNVLASAIIPLGFMGGASALGKFGSKTNTLLSKMHNSFLEQDIVPDMSVLIKRGLEAQALTEDIVQATNKHFGEGYTEGIDSTQTLKSKIAKDTSIPLETKVDFLQEIQANGKAKGFGDEDSLIDLTDAEKNAFISQLDAPERHILHDADGISEVENTLKLNPEAELRADNPAFYDKRMKETMDGIGNLPETEQVRLKNIYDEGAETATLFDDASTIYTTCVGRV
jgi:hypothetical protein